MKIITGGVLTFTAACLSVPAFSQTTDREETTRLPPRGVEEVVVTAQKRQEKLQDVPISISVLSGDELDRSTVTSANDALRNVPGVSIVSSQIGGMAQVAVRGVTAGQAQYTGSSPAAYYLDSMPFGFAKSAFVPDPDVYDLERIEVLRGPQGTLYGASALSGVVRVLTREVNLDELEFKARTSVSNTRNGGENYRGDVALNMPIVEGRLGARAVVGYQDLSGWIDKPNEKDANDAQRRNIRLKVDAQPAEQLSIGLSAWLSRDDYGAPSLAGPDNVRSSSRVKEPIANDFDLYGLGIGYDFPWASVTSQTSYLDYISRSSLDLATSIGLPIDYTFGSEAVSQEVSVNSTHEGPWRWSIGGMYRDAEDHIAYFIQNVTVLPAIYSSLSESYALFGEATRLFLDGRLELTGGLRTFKDKVGLKETSRFTGPVAPSQLIDVESTFSATTPRVILTWHPHPRATLYASYAEGFRSGADQSPTALVGAPGLPALEPDTLANYELGAKGSMLDGRLSFDAAFYYMDWQDVQQSLNIPLSGFGTTVTSIAAQVNGDSASGIGADFGLTIQPLDGLSVGANISWNDLTLDSDVVSFPGGGPATGVVLYEKGGRLNWSSEYTAGASVSYVFPLGANGFEGELSAAGNYVSGSETRSLAGTRVNVTANDSMLTTQAHAAIRSPYGWTATLFAENLNNELNSASVSAQIDRSVRIRPRTIGLQFEYSF